MAGFRPAADSVAGLLMVSCLVFPAVFFSWIHFPSTPLLIIHRPLHLSLVGPDPEVWGEGRVGAREVGACPSLVMCCAGFLVGSEYIHSTVKPVCQGNKLLVPRLPFLLLCRAENRKSPGNSRLWRPLISCSSPLPVPLTPAPWRTAVRKKTAGTRLL